MTTEHIPTPAVIIELPPAQGETLDVLDEVLQERRRQVQRFGQQDHPWNAGYSKPFMYLLQLGHYTDVQQIKDYVEEQAMEGQLGYVEILFEEIAEAFDEFDVKRVREELIQVAAVAVAAIESIDRNGR